MKLLLGTQNQNKVKEIHQILSGKFDCLSLMDMGFHQELQEDGITFEENAIQKVKQLKDKFPELSCFSEDSGLEVYALEGKPGVLSARYAGAQKLDSDNISKLLREMKNVSDRSARFVTVIALHLFEQIHTFEGTCEGEIAYEPRGDKGFGYDPIFIPKGSLLTFAEMESEQKHEFSHRAKAIQKMKTFLDELDNKV